MGIHTISPQLIAPLFKHTKKPLILSCLQGYMGNAYAIESGTHPDSAQIIIGDFCFFAGMPNDELVRNIPGNFKSKSILMIPQDELWAEKIEKIYGHNAQGFTRYALKQKEEKFDEDRLENYTQKMPPFYTLSRIDKNIYEQIIEHSWSKDLCSVFSSCDAFMNSGIGIAALYNGQPVSGASSYVIYRGGIEIEVDTKPEHQNKGLATACASKLILECLNQGLIPNWDAHDLRSASLAKKLGYVHDYKYAAYCVEVSNVSKNYIGF